MSMTVGNENPFVALNKMVETMTEAVNQRQQQTQPAPSLGGKIFMLVFALCGTALIIMATIKLGMMLFLT